MKFLTKRKDGGPESTVTGYWLAEIKSLFSIVLLKFENGSRDAYHSHAFNSLNWVLKGEVEEETIEADHYGWNTERFAYKPSLKPILTSRERFHKVVSKGTTWVFSIRGPWVDKWREFTDDGLVTLTHGRKVV